MALSLASAVQAALDLRRKDHYLHDFIEEDAVGEASVGDIVASEAVGYPPTNDGHDYRSGCSAPSKRSLLEDGVSNTDSSSECETVIIEEPVSKLEPERLAVKLQEAPQAGGAIYFGPRINLAELRVIVLAGLHIDPACLRATLISKPMNLEKLDVSYCKLQQTSWPSVWASLPSLSVLWLHGNALTGWDDAQAVAMCPNLQWLTLFENPIAGQPEYRQVVIRKAPQILALDTWVITDDERFSAKAAALDAWAPTRRMSSTSSNYSTPVAASTTKRRMSRFQAEPEQSRFIKGNNKSVLSLRLKPHVGKPSCAELLEEVKDELNTLKQQAVDCSAARFLQACWAGKSSRQASARKRALKTLVAVRIQNAFRAWSWRRSMINYTKDYLTEIDEIDLLLSAQDRLRQHAHKLIEAAVRRWVRRRKERKDARDAGIHLTRIARGFLTRLNLVRKVLCLTECTKIYFPEGHEWEFIALLNVVRRKHGLEPLPHEYHFEDADMLAVRLPAGVDLPNRKAVITRILCIRNASLIRRCASGRFPEHPWDGPRHSLAEGRSALDRIHQAHAFLHRRGASVNNHCRKCFLESCAVGSHPIHRRKSQNLEPGIRSHFGTAFLNAGEDEWSSEIRRSLAKSGKVASRLLESCLQEARELGAPSVRVLRSSGQSMDIGHGGKRDEDGGTTNYSAAVWLSQRLLSYTCESPELAHSLICALASFRGTSGHAPIVKPIPFLPERMMQEACAFTTIQATFRAHHARCSLPCSLIGAAVTRRAVLCIQRCWRWSILKRRFQLLEGIFHAYKSANSSYLYVEERLFLALNLINSITRYSPMLLEQSLGFCCFTNPSTVALVRGGLMGTEDTDRPSRVRSHGLPTWLWKSLGQFQAIDPEAIPLRTVCGLQGLLLDGLNYDPTNENNIITVSRTAQGESSGDSLRFIELRFPSVSVAKMRAAILFMCTWSSRHRLAVPLLNKPMLYSSSVSEDLLRLWDIYSLTWQQGDRFAVSLLRQRCQKYVSDLVPACGREFWSSASRSEWIVGDAKVWCSSRQRSGGNCDNRRRSFARHSSLLPPVRSSRSSALSTSSCASSGAVKHHSKRRSSFNTEASSGGRMTRASATSGQDVADPSPLTLSEKVSSPTEDEESDKVAMIPLPPTSGKPRPGSRVTLVRGRHTITIASKDRNSPPLERTRSGTSEILLPPTKHKRHTRR